MDQAIPKLALEAATQSIRSYERNIFNIRRPDSSFFLRDALRYTQNDKQDGVNPAILLKIHK